MLVCRAWRTLLTCPSPVWHDIHLHSCNLSWSPHHKPHGAAWFTARPACIQTFIDHRLYAPPSIVRAMLAHNHTTLRTLDVVALQSADTWPLIARCLHLQHLRVHIIRGRAPWTRVDGLERLSRLNYLELSGAELLAPRDVEISSLTGLTSLTLHVPVVSLDLHALTRLQSLSLPELYCARALPAGLSSTLTSLRIDAWRPTHRGAAGDTLDVVALLTAPPIAPDAASISTALRLVPHLASLHLSGYHGAPDLCIASLSLATLTSLTSLTLRRCGLEDLPAGIQALVALRELDLRHNYLRGLPAWVKSLTKLKCVRLERQRGFSLVLPLSLAARRGLSLHVAPTVEALHGGGSRLRLVIRLVSGCGETLCHLTMVGGRKGPGWRGLRVGKGAWRASLRPGDAGPHIGGGGVRVQRVHAARLSCGAVQRARRA